MRELGVTFELYKGPRVRPASRGAATCCRMFSAARNGRRSRAGLRQRMKAFESFLRDIYGHAGNPAPRRPARSRRCSAARFSSARRGPGTAARALPAPWRGCASNAIRRARSRSAASISAMRTGISYMVQNRRVLARVAPETFSDLSVASIAETPTSLLEALRDTADVSFGEPLIVMLSAGAGQPVLHRAQLPRPAHGRAAGARRRPARPRRQRLPENHRRPGDGSTSSTTAWPTSMLDPLVLERGSLLGVPGLVHCIRKKTVSLVNALGSQLADDRALLAFAPRIIRFYLGEPPILPTLPTYWCGDRDQCELVLGNLADSASCRAWATASSATRAASCPRRHEETALRTEIRKAPHLFVAQPIAQGARTLCFEEGRPVERRQDHLVFALRKRRRHRGFPGRADPRRAGGQSLHGGRAGRRQQGYMGAQRRRRADHDYSRVRAGGERCSSRRAG